MGVSQSFNAFILIVATIMTATTATADNNVLPLLSTLSPLLLSMNQHGYKFVYSSSNRGQPTFHSVIKQCPLTVSVVHPWCVALLFLRVHGIAGLIITRILLFDRLLTNFHFDQNKVDNGNDETKRFRLRGVIMIMFIPLARMISIKSSGFSTRAQYVSPQ